MIPLGLRTGFEWRIDMWIGNTSPGSTPARRILVVAVMVPSCCAEITGVSVAGDDAVHLLELGSLTIWKLCELSVIQLELLRSLVTGLSGGLESEQLGDTSGVLASFGMRSPDFDLLDLFFILLDTGSKDITFGFGTGIGNMSIGSRSTILLSQDNVGEIVVGRVRVEVIM